MTARQPRLEPRKKPVQKRSREKVDAILAAAAQVFEEHGMAAGTTNRIAERAGVSIGTLYQYFPCKEAVAAALLEQHVAETVGLLNALVRRAAERRPSMRDGLHEYVSRMMALHAGRPRLQHILLEEVPRSDALHQRQMRLRQEAVDSVARMMEANPAIARPDLDRAAYLVVEAVESLTHRYAAHPEHQTMGEPEFVDEVVDLLEGYLTLASDRPRRARRSRPARPGPR
jgi:AcrR family transcriptional regulator